MFKSFINNIKALGKKAVGYVRGLNGNKAAALGTSLIAKYNPLYGAAAAPFLQQLGNFINEKLDSIAYDKEKKGGVTKPKDRYTRHIASLYKTKDDIE